MWVELFIRRFHRDSYTAVIYQVSQYIILFSESNDFVVRRVDGNEVIRTRVFIFALVRTNDDIHDL